MMLNIKEKAELIDITMIGFMLAVAGPFTLVDYMIPYGGFKALMDACLVSLSLLWMIDTMGQWQGNMKHVDSMKEAFEEHQNPHLREAKKAVLFGLVAYVILITASI